MVSGDVLTVPAQRHILGLAAPASRILVTFDGAARRVGGLPAAGGAAVLWAVATASGARTRLASAWVALPPGVGALAAEAWGCRLACDLLARFGGLSRDADVAGDNLVVVRYCAAEAGVREPLVHELLDPALDALRRAGWRLRFFATRRAFNAAADRAAVAAASWAAQRARAGAVLPAMRFW